MSVLPIQPFSGGREPFLVAEFDDAFVVYKPAGMHSVSAGKRAVSRIQTGADASAESLPSLAEWADRNLGKAGDEKMPESGMLSRLDMETSGLVLFARNPAGRAYFLGLQASGGILKRYRLRAVASPRELPGSLPLRSGIVPLSGRVIESRFRSYGPRGARVACIAPGMEDLARRILSPALHRTEILENSVSGEGIELDVRIGAGFRHQIRAHMAWIGWPICGDAVYGGCDADRLYLEAYNIEYTNNNGEIRVVDLYR